MQRQASESDYTKPRREEKTPAGLLLLFQRDLYYCRFQFLANKSELFFLQTNRNYSSFVIREYKLAATAPLTLCHTLNTAPGMAAIG